MEQELTVEIPASALADTQVEYAILYNSKAVFLYMREGGEWVFKDNLKQLKPWNKR